LLPDSVVQYISKYNLYKWIKKILIWLINFGI
jgi:hypothetical protein